jgi:hypothetical protein
MSTRFHSLYTRFDQEATPEAPQTLRLWPAIYREPLPAFNLADYRLQIRIENQIPKLMSMAQLATLPSFTENRRLTSKAGWTYYGQWKGVTFQTLFSLFSTPNLYPWVRLETLTGQHAILERMAILNCRLLTAGDGEPFSTLYGGPLWVHCFDHYIEYAIPHLKSIVLLQGTHQVVHPAEALGFSLAEARVMPGTYYDIHRERIATL